MPQYIQFSDLEGLKIAAEMERRGGEFYQHAAQVATNEETIALLNALAADEIVHEQEFHELALRFADDEIGIECYDDEVSAYLSAVAADVVFQRGLMGMVKDKGFESPYTILSTAIQSEKDAILFYTEMIAQAHHPRAATAFQEIVRQEKTHLGKLQHMLLALGA